MATQPNTVIKLLTGIALDNTYTDSIYFDNEAMQRSFFLGKTYKTYNANTYQRVNKNTLRLPESADSLYNCNYMMFQNSAYGNKWFYAFITEEPRYINDNVCEIVYEIDVLQTWLFEAVLKPCFVEREHQATDIAGDNTLPEPVDIGDIKSYYEDSVIFTSYDVVVAHAPFNAS